MSQPPHCVSSDKAPNLSEPPLPLVFSEGCERPCQTYLYRSYPSLVFIMSLGGISKGSYDYLLIGSIAKLTSSRQQIVRIKSVSYKASLPESES